MDRILEHSQQWLIKVLIFFVPTNLALHVFKDSAHVLGITVDYLIPKLYFSDLIIGSLFLLWLLQTRFRILGWMRLIPQHISLITLGGLLLASLLVSIHQSPNPIAGYWFLLKLIEMSWLAGYLICRLNLAQIKPVLSFTLLFQTAIGLIQWVQKQSLLGYWFLGETTLRTNSYIAKTGITGEIRPLPYGTTPHPNVLAGFLVIGLLLLLCAPIDSNEGGNKNHQDNSLMKLLHLFKVVIFTSPIILVLLLTQSVSGVIVLIIGLLIFKLRKLHWLNGLAIVAILLAAGLAVSPYIESTSVTRRIKLAEISWQMMQAEPWLGVGLNNFTARMTEFGQVVSTTRFLQPVHNIYLLWLAETGLVSTTLLVLFVRKICVTNKQPHKNSKHLTDYQLISFIPLMAIAIIGLADHYPLSLQTGQLLTVLSLALAFGKNEKKAFKQVLDKQ